MNNKPAETTCKFCGYTTCEGNCRDYLINEIIELHKGSIDLKKQLMNKSTSVEKLKKALLDIRDIAWHMSIGRNTNIDIDRIIKRIDKVVKQKKKLSK